MTIKTPAALKASFATFVAVGAVLGATPFFAGTAYAAETPAAAMKMEHTQSQPVSFQKKTYALKGAVTVEHRGDRTVLVFSDDFKTKKGPDLKVFLSKNAVASATGDNATTEAVRLGVLQSNKGAQEYILPEGINLADFSSVLVHCEAFSKLWGGADIS